MANNTYTVNLSAMNGNTVILTDDGSGTDWLVITGSYDVPTNISLQYTSEFGTATSASGTYWVNNVGSRLQVNGQIENVRGSSSKDDIIGNELGNVLYGDADKTGPGGNDTISGADGNDTIFGGAGADSLSGGGQADSIQGNGGADTISGGAGVDTVEGGAGPDSLSGGADAGDTVSYANSAAAVSVLITFGTTTTGSGGDAQGDMINGFSNVWGSAFGDTITDTVSGEVAFGGNANRFDGKAGNDTIQGGGGSDTVLGGDGNDSLGGGQGNDSLNGGAGNDKLDLGSGNDKSDGGTGNDTIQGGDGTDNLKGGDGNDSLSGGGLADQLTGGAGDDTLTGGGGGDVFLFVALTDAVPAGTETITDFNAGQGDKIDLSQIDALPYDGDQAFIFRGTSSFTGLGQVRYQAAEGGIELQINTDADLAAEMTIFLAGVTSLTAGDFVL